MWKELYVMRPVVHQKYLFLSCTSLSDTAEQNFSVYLISVLEKTKQKLQTVFTFRDHNPAPRKAMQCSGTAATSLCQLGSLSGVNAPGGTADVCAPTQMGASLPALVFAGVPRVGAAAGWS